MWSLQPPLVRIPPSPLRYMWRFDVKKRCYCLYMGVYLSAFGIVVPLHGGKDRVSTIMPFGQLIIFFTSVYRILFISVSTFLVIHADVDFLSFYGTETPSYHIARPLSYFRGLWQYPKWASSSAMSAIQSFPSYPCGWYCLALAQDENHGISSPATSDFDPRYLADCLSVRSLMPD